MNVTEDAKDTRTGERMPILKMSSGTALNGRTKWAMPMKSNGNTRFRRMNGGEDENEEAERIQQCTKL